MIVENEKIFAMRLKSKLEKLGYMITDITPSGEEAIKKVDKNLPDIVLMGLDLKGDMDGIETANAMIKHHNLPIIYTTAYTDNTIFQKAAVISSFRDKFFLILIIGLCSWLLIAIMIGGLLLIYV